MSTSGSRWRRHRRRSGPPWGRILVAALVLLVVVAGWWWFARRAGADVPTPSPAEATVPSSASELGYSVLVASFGEPAPAREQARAWAGDGLYFVAPTTVEDGTYWRLYRGAVAGRAAAEALNRRLVEHGRKASASPWDVRPTGLAFRIAVYGGRDEATSRVEALDAAGVPAYVLPAAADGKTAWQVYAGAYEAAAAAAALRRRLRDEGIEAELVRRRGEPTDR